MRTFVYLSALLALLLRRSYYNRPYLYFHPKITRETLNWSIN